MTPFLIVSGLLALGALLFVIPPLLSRKAASRNSSDSINTALYRDQLGDLDDDLRAGTLSPEHYEKARQEIEARLLEDVGTGDAVESQPLHGRASAIALGLALPLCAIALYLAVGSPQALVPGQGTAAGGGAHEITAGQIEEMIQKLEARLQAEPDNAEGWIMLARTYNAVDRFDKAAAAYAKATKQLPNDAQLLADYADTLAMAQGRRLQGEPEQLIQRALKIDPNNIKALALSGSVAFDTKQYPKAVDYWERILRLVPADSDFARQVSSSVAEARSLAGTGSAPAAPPATASTATPSAPPAKVSPATTAAAGKSGISGTVKLAPELAATVKPTDIVFIFARAASGPRMPLAILRKQVQELPVTFSLNDSMAMTPEMSLSKFPQVVVGARISKSGGANSQPGDLEGYSSPIANSTAGVSVVINSVVR